MGVSIGRSREYGLALLVFTILTCALTYPLPLHMGSASLGSDPDVHTFTWTLGWDVHAFTTRPWNIFDANIFFPYKQTLAYSENLIGSAFFAAPVVWLTGNYVLAMNVVAMLSVVLCGVGAYVLARQVGLSPASSLACGLIFAFSPARFFRFQQIHLTAIQWIPFALASLHAYVDGGRRRDLRLAIGFTTLQALTSLHGAVCLLLAITALLIQRVLTGTPLRPIERLKDIGAPGALLALPAVLLAIPYLRVQREAGLIRSLENWIPTPESFLASLTHVHLWILETFLSRSVNERASAFLFPGYLPIALALVALLGLQTRPFRRDIAAFAAMTAIALLLSIGPPLSLWPYVYWLPGLNFIRIPSRFFLLAVLGLAVLSAIGLERIVRLIDGRRRQAAGVVACMLLVAEFTALPLPLTPFTVEFAPVDRWIASRPSSEAIAEVPVGPLTRSHSTYMLHSMAHWHPTVHAHSSVLPPLHEQVYDRLRSFPDAASLKLLADIGVSLVIVHHDMYPPGEWRRVETALAQYGAELSPEYADDSGRVYRVKRAPADP